MSKKVEKLDVFLESIENSEFENGFGQRNIKQVRVEIKDPNGKTVRDNTFKTYQEVSDYVYDKLKKDYTITISVV